MVCFFFLYITFFPNIVSSELSFSNVISMDCFGGGVCFFEYCKNNFNIIFNIISK